MIILCNMPRIKKKTDLNCDEVIGIVSDKAIPFVNRKNNVLASAIHQFHV
jgi:hypothetical protein